MQNYSNINLENIYFNLELGHSAVLMKEKISPNKAYFFENIKNVSVTPWYHNTCNHNWNIKKNSIILIELPAYKEMFYLLNTSIISKDDFLDKSLDIILKREDEFCINSLRSAYSLMKKGNLIIPVSKNVSGLDREFYLFKSVMFNLISIDLFYSSIQSKYKNIDIIIGNTHIPTSIHLIKNFSNLNVAAKEAVGRINELSQFEKYENFETISSLSSQSIMMSLNQISEILMAI